MDVEGERFHALRYMVRPMAPEVEPESVARVRAVLRAAGPPNHVFRTDAEALRRITGAAVAAVRQG